MRFEIHRVVPWVPKTDRRNFREEKVVEDEMMEDGETTNNTSMEAREIGDVPDFDALQDEDSDEILKDLTARVNSVSLSDREAGLHDLHGIGGIDEKSADEEHVLVNKMRLALSEKYSYKAAEAFRMASAASPEYTRDASFLLMFLRSENYNTQAAVKRLFAFFRYKLRLFGPDKIGKPMITLSGDLSPNDMKCYSAGFYQLLPHRDHAGRAQFVYLPQDCTWETRENALRMRFHIWMTALMDEETQKRGAISIVHALDEEALKANPQSRDPMHVWESIQLMHSIPIRFVGIHVCTNPSSVIGKFFSSMARFLGNTGIIRTRFHQGSFGEISQALASFGISNIQIAVSQSGEKKIDKHREQLKTLKALEQAKILTPNKLVVVVPSSTDVLLGRGKPIQNHPGNVRLSLIAESQLAEYDDMTNRQDKTKLAESTMAKMKEAGVRFLTKDNGYWELAADRLARERVSSTFRTVRDRLRITPSALSDSNLRRKRSFEDFEDIS